MFGVTKYCLSLVVNVELHIQFLLRRLDDGVTQSAAVDLLQVQALRVVVVKGRIHQEVEAGREVPVMLRIEVDDVGLGARGAGLGDRAVGPGKIKHGAVARVEPVHRGNCSVPARPRR